MKKLPNTNKTLILTIVCTLIVSLFFGSLVYAFADRTELGNKMENTLMQDEGKQRGNDRSQSGPQSGDDSEFNGRRDSNRNSKSDNNFGAQGEPDDNGPQDLPEDRNDKNSIGEIKSIENNTVKIELKTRGRDQDSQTEEKSYTVSSDVDLSSFAAGDTVRFETDDNDQITSMEKFDMKEKPDSQDQNKNENSAEQKEQSQTSFSTSV